MKNIVKFINKEIEEKQGKLKKRIPAIIRRQLNQEIEVLKKHLKAIKNNLMAL